AEEEVAAFVTNNQRLIESIEPSFFEVTVVMAFDFFARKSVDIAIVEVGLGGRLDSTNVITPIASVITNIGLDHTDVLGDTLSQIAREKAGIIKPGVPAIIGETQAEIADVFQDVAESVKAPIIQADQQYTVQDGGVVQGLRHALVARVGGPLQPFRLDLLGSYQLRNLPAVLATVEILQPTYPVSPTAELTALASVTSQTGLKGRFQILQEYPRVIADTAHNQAGLIALFETIRSLSYDTLRIIIGMVADKDRTKALDVLPSSAVYYFCQAQTPRSLPVDELQIEASRMGRIGEAFVDVNEALTAALQEALPSDLILITGSNYIIAELTNL
ncbi:bifunctional folylpolyglutamate synthase/dihydrofolate synthase, partial [Spirosoma sp.]|uniref:bifunctional folylpolyglutamate synthase/dihydrofolate synthase n=1 Tax=Spirosoma sp. TaxID=1899569 RepID=UPI003B3A6AFE